MRFRFALPIVVFAGLGLTAAHADQADIDKRVLNNRLNKLESQSIQRQGRAPELIDLLNRQNDKIAGQELNRLKTRQPRDAHVPLLERKLLRSRRPGGRFVPR